MPSKSQAQHRYMEGVAHGSIPASPATVKAAKDYVAADAGKAIHTLPDHIHAALRSHRAQKAARTRHKKGYPE